MGVLINEFYEQNILSVYDSINFSEYDVLRIRDLKDMLTNCLDRNNHQELKVLKVVLDFLKGQNKKNKVYFKLAWDKHNNLIAIYFNLDSFIEKGNEKILLFADSMQCRMTFLQMSFWNRDSQFIKPCRNNVAHVYINEFRSFYPRMGHGTYILKNLDNIINEVNKQILLNSEDLFPVKSITGIVVPMVQIINYEELLKLYTSYGFSTINQKKSNGRSKTIIIKSIEKENK